MSNRNQQGRTRRPLYGPPPSRRNNSTLTYWVPLVVTATIALGGVAAWIWSERSDDSDDEGDYPSEKPPRPQPGQGGPYPTQGSQPYPGPAQSSGNVNLGGPLPSQSAGPQGAPPPGGEAASYYSGARSTQPGGEDAGWMGRVQGTLRRTPSPQQFFDQASKQVSAGMAAAGAALGSIMEEEGNGREGQRRGRAGRDVGEREREGFSDHERWSEEAEEKSRVEAESERRAGDVKSGREGKGKGRARKSVAVVVNADTGAGGDNEDEDGEYRTEHASILSHLPFTFDSNTTDLTVLIYAPTLTKAPSLDYKPYSNSVSPTPLSSSYGTITTPGSELRSMSPHPSTQSDFGATKAFDSLWTAALSLVSEPSHILPFQTPTGYIPILRMVAPQLVYLTDSPSLSGRDGENVAQIKGWVGQTVLVVGDEGHGGLADTETETEDEGPARGDRWYEHSSLVGLGKGLEVVDAARVGDDWGRRVGGRE